ncbi:MAG: M15 family metallopeptidase [Erysipelotrichaceae bacterium]
MKVESRKPSHNYTKTKRKLNSKFLILLCTVLLLIIGCFKIPKLLSDHALRELGYDNDTLEVIYEKNLKTIILENEYYTEILEANILKDSFDVTYIKLYMEKAEVSDEDIFLYDKLSTKGYGEDQQVNLVANLESYELTPLLVFDYQEDEQAYIEDCLNNRSTNSIDAFYLDGSYYELYANPQEVENLGDVSMNVSKTYYLPSDYVPENLTLISVAYAASDVYMVEEAAEYFVLMCQTLKSAGYTIYATNSYRSYYYQTDLYAMYSNNNGSDVADTFAARPGYSEHQTGYAVDVTALYEEFTDFGESDAYTWMCENAHLYGFIQRYPEDKTSITGYSAESWHWRYLGVELATQVKESGLTYDEYYELYLK